MPANQFFGAPPWSASGFDRVAWCYDALAGLVFGSALRRAQRAALAGLPAGAPHILVLGGGTGWVLTEIWRCRPQATVLYIDASARMLRRTEARLSRQPTRRPQVELRHGTEQSLRSDETFDVIITFFVLDCIAPAALGPALQRLNAARRARAPWLLADFRPTQRWWQRALVAAMYAFFRAAARLPVGQLPVLRPLLAELGLWPQRETVFFGGAVEAVVFAESPGPAAGTVPGKPATRI